MNAEPAIKCSFKQFQLPKTDRQLEFANAISFHTIVHLLGYVHLEIPFRVFSSQMFLKCWRGSCPQISFALYIFFLPLLRAEVMLFLQQCKILHTKRPMVWMNLFWQSILAVEYWIYFSV
jgi:hypothetical protein